MKHVEIKFNRVIEDGFLGRNGNGKSSGMAMFLDSDEKTVWIEPLTSRGVVGRSWQRIPVDQVPELIDALQKFL